MMSRVCGELARYVPWPRGELRYRDLCRDFQIVMHGADDLWKITDMFKERHVVITGAASGIGKALAQHFDRAGAKLALCDVNEKQLSAVVQELSGVLCTQAFDISDKGKVQAFAKLVQDAHGVPDYVINNAGVAVFEPVQEYSYEDSRWLFEINFWGMLHGIHAFLPGMLEKNSGTIVNLSSIFGIVGYPGQSAYCASKFAIRGYTEAMQLDLKGTGVKAVLVHPGGVLTNIAQSARISEKNGEPVNRDELCKKFESVAVTTPEQAAQTIADGLSRGKSRIMVGSDAKKLRLISRLMPDSYGRVYSDEL